MHGTRVLEHAWTVDFTTQSFIVDNAVPVRGTATPRLPRHFAGFGRQVRVPRGRTPTRTDFGTEPKARLVKCL